MRTSLKVVAAMTAMGLAPAALSGTASAAVRASAIPDIRLTSISCAPGGACAAGGVLVDDTSPFHAHALVLTELNGQWSTAIDVPGLAAIKASKSQVNAVSCVPGGCVAGGSYQGAGRRSHPFVTSERNGHWSRLVTVSSATKASAVTKITSLSCSGPQKCVAGGEPAFVVTEAHGRWGHAHLFAKGKGGRVAVSCTLTGNCAAAWAQFVASERNGHWGPTTTLPGLAKLGTNPAIASVSCTAAVNCAVGGTYSDHGAQEVFVADKRNGEWGKAIELPGFTALNTEHFGELASVSCISAGNCVAGGSYTVPADFDGGVFGAFVANEQNGHWGKAIEVPGLPSTSATFCEPDTGPCNFGRVFSVSCAPGGTCAAGGSFGGLSAGQVPAFVATYKSGRWTVSQIPGLAALDTGQQSEVTAVSCTAAGKCAAAGDYLTTESVSRPAFVADEQDGTVGQAHAVQLQG